VRGREGNTKSEFGIRKWERMSIEHGAWGVAHRAKGMVNRVEVVGEDAEGGSRIDEIEGLTPGA